MALMDLSGIDRSVAVEAAISKFIAGELSGDEERDLRVSVTPDDWRRILLRRRERLTAGGIDGSAVSLGLLPAGCTVLDMKAGLFGQHALVVMATDKGLFVAEVGKSRLTKLEPIDAAKG